MNRLEVLKETVQQAISWEKVHSFLLIGEERAALIDTGLGIDHIKRITDQLTDLLIFVLTTHVHADHIGSHGEFEELYVQEKEEDWLINGIKGLTIEQIRKIMCKDITIPVPKSFNPDTYTPFGKSKRRNQTRRYN
ncbi:MBL fold metallo-hydrolase [Bacillaceae bacterium Marseille-Q3522]|nr:MBL fold metallo-hydrolase [Bacillaceae bacterium Marseille-Q3522]